MRFKYFICFIILIMLCGCSKIVKEHHIVINIKNIEHGIITESINKTIKSDKVQACEITNLIDIDIEDTFFIGINLDGSLKDFLKPHDEIILQDSMRIFVIVKTQTNPFIIDNVARTYITCDDDITTKKSYVDAQIKITDKTYTLEETNVSIRLRGNSSLTAPKKSYKLKFDKKVDLFGMGSDKEWALIANYFDPSFIRNYLAYNIAKSLNLPYSVDCMFTEVYLNNRCIGLYLLTETVKTGKSRVDIEVPFDETSKEIPFLLELDMKMTSVSDPESMGIENIDYFFAPNMMPVACKYPKDFTTSNITKDQYNYIKQCVSDLYKYMYKDTYQDYIDIDTAVKYFLVQELMMNIDINHSSVYFYKEVGSPLKFGPVWDFDISLGNCNYVSNYSPFMTMKEVNGGSDIFNALMEHGSFRKRFVEMLHLFNDTILPNIMSAQYSIINRLNAFVLTDDLIWNHLNASFWPKPEELVGKSFEEQVSYTLSYLKVHTEYLIELYSK